MDSREHVFDVVILVTVGDELPWVLYREQSIVAKDEDAAKIKAVDLARQHLNEKLDLDEIEVLVTRPFADAGAIKGTWPKLVPAPLYCPAYPDYPSYPQPLWYAGTFRSGYLTTSNESAITVKTGSTIDD